MRVVPVNAFGSQGRGRDFGGWLSEHLVVYAVGRQVVLHDTESKATAFVGAASNPANTIESVTVSPDGRSVAVCERMPLATESALLAVQQGGTAAQVAATEGACSAVTLMPLTPALASLDGQPTPEGGFFVGQGGDSRRPDNAPKPRLSKVHTCAFPVREFAGSFLHAAFSSDGAFVAAYGEVSPAAAASANATARRLGREEHASSPRAPTGGPSEDGAKLHKARRVIACWKVSSGKLVGVAEPRQAINRLQVRPFAAPLADVPVTRSDASDGAGGGGGTSADVSGVGLALSGIPLSRQLLISASGSGYLRGWRLGSHGALWEVPLLSAHRESDADIVDHCWARPEGWAAALGAWMKRDQFAKLHAAIRRKQRQIDEANAAAAGDTDGEDGKRTSRSRGKASSAARKRATAGHATASRGRGGGGDSGRAGATARDDAELHSLQAELDVLLGTGDSTAADPAALAMEGHCLLAALRGGAGLMVAPGEAPGAEPVRAEAGGGGRDRHAAAGNSGDVVRGTYDARGLLLFPSPAAPEELGGEVAAGSAGAGEQLSQLMGMGSATGFGAAGSASVAGGGAFGFGAETGEDLDPVVARSISRWSRGVAVVGRDGYLGLWERVEDASGAAEAMLDPMEVREAMGGSIGPAVEGLESRAAPFRLVRSLRLGSKTLDGVISSPMGSHLLVASPALGVRVLTVGEAEAAVGVGDEQLLKPLHGEGGGHTRAVTSLSACIQLPLLASAGQDGTLHVWNYLDPQCEAVEPCATSALCLALHPDGRTLACGFPDKLAVYNVCLATKTLTVWKENTSYKTIRSISYSGGGSLLSFSSGSGVVVVDSVTLQPLHQLGAHTSIVETVNWAESIRGSSVSLDAGSGKGGAEAGALPGSEARPLPPSAAPPPALPKSDLRMVSTGHDGAVIVWTGGTRDESFGRVAKGLLILDAVMVESPDAFTAATVANSMRAAKQPIGGMRPRLNSGGRVGFSGGAGAPTIRGSGRSGPGVGRAVPNEHGAAGLTGAAGAATGSSQRDQSGSISGASVPYTEAQGLAEAVVAGMAGGAAVVAAGWLQVPSKSGAGGGRGAGGSGGMAPMSALTAGGTSIALGSAALTDQRGVPVLQVTVPPAEGDPGGSSSTMLVRTGVALTRLAILPSRGCLVAGTAQGRLRVYKWPLQVLPSTAKQPGARVVDVQALPVIDQLRLGTLDSPPYLELPMHAGPVTGLSATRDGRYVFSAGGDGGVFVLAVPWVARNVGGGAGTPKLEDGKEEEEAAATAAAASGSGSGSDSQRPKRTAAATAADGGSKTQAAWFPPRSRDFNGKVSLVERDVLAAAQTELSAARAEAADAKSTADDRLKMLERQWSEERTLLVERAEAEVRRLQLRLADVTEEKQQLLADWKEERKAAVAKHERELRARQNEYERRLTLQIDRFDKLDEQLEQTRQTASSALEMAARKATAARDAERRQFELERQQLGDEVSQLRDRLGQEALEREADEKEALDEHLTILGKLEASHRRQQAEEGKKSAEAASIANHLRKRLGEMRAKAELAEQRERRRTEELRQVQATLKQRDEQLRSRSEQLAVARRSLEEKHQDVVDLQTDVKAVRNHRFVLEQSLGKALDDRQPLARRVQKLEAQLASVADELQKKLEEAHTALAEVARLKDAKKSVDAALRATEGLVREGERALADVLRDVESLSKTADVHDTAALARDLYRRYVKRERGWVVGAGLPPARQRALGLPLPGASRGVSVDPELAREMAATTRAARRDQPSGGQGLGSTLTSPVAGAGGASGAATEAGGGGGNRAGSAASRRTQPGKLGRDVLPPQAREAMAELERQRDHMGTGAAMLSRQLRTMEATIERRSAAALRDNSLLLREVNALRKQLEQSQRENKLQGRSLSLAQRALRAAGLPVPVSAEEAAMQTMASSSPLSRRLRGSTRTGAGSTRPGGFNSMSMDELPMSSASVVGQDRGPAVATTPAARQRGSAADSVEQLLSGGNLGEGISMQSPSVAERRSKSTGGGWGMGRSGRQSQSREAVERSGKEQQEPPLDSLRVGRAGQQVVGGAEQRSSKSRSSLGTPFRRGGAGAGGFGPSHRTRPGLAPVGADPASSTKRVARALLATESVSKE